MRTRAPPGSPSAEGFANHNRPEREEPVRCFYQNIFVSTELT